MGDEANQHSTAADTPAVGRVSSSASEYTDIGTANSAEVLQYNLDTSGERVKVRGVVRNNSGERLSPVSITVELLDSNGQSLGKKETFPGNTPDFAMAPGQKAGFNVEFDEPVDDCASARISVYTEPAEEQEDMPLTYTDLEVSDVALEDGKLAGRVRNSGKQRAEHLLVAVVLYDRKSRVVGAGAADVEQGDLGPGEETAFSFRQADGDVDTWDVAASARGEQVDSSG